MDELLRELKPHATLRTVKKGSNILFQGEVPRHVMFIRDGYVRVYTITSNGEERLVSLFGRGDVIPLSWALGQSSTTLFYHDALTDVRLFAVPKDKFNDTLQKHPEHQTHLLNHVGREYASLLLRITGLEQSRAIEKIGFTLYYLVFRYGREDKNGIFTIDLKISQSLLASMVGLTRESTARNLKILDDKGVISYSKSTYTINKQRLEQYLGEDSFRDLIL